MIAIPPVSPDFDATHRQCAPFIARETMKSLVKNESNFAHLSIGINGGAKLQHQPRTKQEAVATAEWLMSNGYNADFGWSQINSANVRRKKLDLNDVFDPCKNLRMGADIFLDNYNLALSKFKDPDTATLAAISAYNTGDFRRGFKNGYVQRIVYTAVQFQRAGQPGAKTAAPTAQKQVPLRPIPKLEFQTEIKSEREVKKKGLPSSTTIKN